MSRQALSELEIKQLVDSAYNDAQTFTTNIQKDREKALEAYNREPYGDEQEGQSKVITSEVYDTCEAVLTDVMEAVYGTDRICVFVPRDEQDVEPAALETDYVHHVYFQQNDGFNITRTWIQDGIIQKNGVVKCYWDEKTDVVQETYNQINDDEFLALVSDDELELKEHTEEQGETEAFDEFGQPMVVMQTLHDAVFERTEDASQIRIINVAPEDVLVNRDHNNLNLNEANYVCHRIKVTASDLIVDGYDRALVDSIPSYNEEDLNTERQARYNDEGLVIDDSYQREIMVYEHYIMMDKDGDGKNERYLVKMAGQANGILLECEKVDRVPLHSWSSVPAPHKYYGLSKADETMDLQRINTVFMRQTIDNLVQTNHPTRLVGKSAGFNMTEMASPRIGKLLLGTNIEQVRDLVVPFVGDSTMNFMGFLDKIRERRTGVSEAQQGLTPETLSSATNLVGAMLMSKGQARLKLVARTFAETGFKSLLLHIHELASKYESQERMIDFGNGFTQIIPRDWKRRVHMTVRVGIGYSDKMEKITQYREILTLQQQAMMAGLPIATPSNIYATIVDMGKQAGMPEIKKYFTDPATVPPAPPQPDPIEAQVKVLREQGMIDLKKKEAELSQDANEFSLKMAQDRREFEEEMKLKREQLDQTYELKMRDIQQKYEIEAVK